MTHCEQITVYQYVSEPDNFAGQIPITPILQDNAPTFATIQQISGRDTTISLRLATENVYDVWANWRNDFTWQRNMFVSCRFGFLDITNIVEEKRKRLIKLETVFIEGTSETPTGGLMRIYVDTQYGQTSVQVQELAGNTILLGFREGIEKKLVEESPALNELAVDSDGNVTLVSGDIFGDERLAFLYQRTHA